MFINNLRDYWKKLHQKNKCIIKDMIRWKVHERFKENFQKSTYILNGWEITKIVSAKQKSF